MYFPSAKNVNRNRMGPPWSMHPLGTYQASKESHTRKSFSGSLILVTLNLVLSAATCGTEYHVSFTSSAAEAAIISSNWSSSSLSWHASTCLIILISFAAFSEAVEMQCEVIKFWPGALVRLFSLQTAPLETSECEEATKKKEAAEATMIIEPVVMKDLSTERWSIRSIQVIYGHLVLGQGKICCQGSFWWQASAYPGALESSTTNQRNANASRKRFSDASRIINGFFHPLKQSMIEGSLFPNFAARFRLKPLTATCFSGWVQAAWPSPREISRPGTSSSWDVGEGEVQVRHSWLWPTSCRD